MTVTAAGHPVLAIPAAMLAGACAGFFTAFLHDPKDAWQRYLALVKKGGTESYAGLVQAAGFAVPFEDGSLAPVAREVAGWIETHQQV